MGGLSGDEIPGHAGAQVASIDSRPTKAGDTRSHRDYEQFVEIIDE
jgi:hypothetical protein